MASDGKKRKIPVNTEESASDPAIDDEVDGRDEGALEEETDEIDVLDEALDAARSDDESDGSSDENEESDLDPRDADFSKLDLGIDDLGAEAIEEFERYKREATENKDKYLRALADFENYKKRVLRERSELLKYQGEKVLFDFLEIVDNLELALEHSSGDPLKLREGVEMIHKLFLNTLGKWSVVGESAIGEVFDPNKHSALSKVPAQDVEPGTVLNELKKAYFYKDRLLRAAEVVVAAEAVAERAPAQEVQESAEQKSEENDSAVVSEPEPADSEAKLEKGA